MSILPGGAGLKIAHHFHGPAVDVAAVDRTPRTDDEDDFRPVCVPGVVTRIFRGQESSSY